MSDDDTPMVRLLGGPGVNSPEDLATRAQEAMTDFRAKNPDSVIPATTLVLGRRDPLNGVKKPLVLGVGPVGACGGPEAFASLLRDVVKDCDAKAVVLFGQMVNDADGEVVPVALAHLTTPPNHDRVWIADIVPEGLGDFHEVPPGDVKRPVIDIPDLRPDGPLDATDSGEVDLGQVDRWSGSRAGFSVVSQNREDLLAIQPFVSSGEVLMREDGKSWDMVPVSVWRGAHGGAVIRFGRTLLFFDPDGSFDGGEVKALNEADTDALQEAFMATIPHRGQAPKESHYDPGSPGHAHETAIWPKGETN